MSRGGRTGQGLVTGVSNRPIAYSPTVTWAGNTITTQSGFYLKLPGLLLVWVSFVESAGAANNTLTITIPTGYTAVTHTGSLTAGVGTIATLATNNFQMGAAAGATTSIASLSIVTGTVGTYSGFFCIPTTN